MDFQSLENPEILNMSHRAANAARNNFTGFEGVARILLSSFGYTLTIISTITVLAVLGVWVLVIVIVVLAVNYIITSRVHIKEKTENDRIAPINRRIDYLTQTAVDFSFGKDMRLFSLDKLLLTHLHSEQEKSFSGQNLIQKLWFRNRSIRSIWALLQELSLYVWLCWRAIIGAINIGNFLMYITSIGAFTTALNGLLTDIASLRAQNEIINDYRKFLNCLDAPSGDALPDSSLYEDGGVIEFKNVSFKYPGTHSYALENVSFSINKYEKLAIVGLNGAGKTTLIKLLMRLYQLESGQILIDNVDIQTFSRNEYFKLFSTVFQEISLFAFSIAENIAMNDKQMIDVSRVKRAAEQAGLGDRISHLDKSFDTPMLKILDLDGVEFSGGENQRLALARALYKDAPFIILDEPTAALDALAEERLYRDFNKLVKNRTTIYISHRLASTRFCDRVILLENGNIVESGTHDELVRLQGKYAELFNIQAQYYRVGNDQEITQ
jgi:ATP-binding cassette subfamily C protein